MGEGEKLPRKPLYSPKNPVILPPRPPKKEIKKPVVEIPPFKTKPWRPPRLPKPKPKPVVEIPPVTLRKRPWRPPLRDRPHDPKKWKPQSRLPPRLLNNFYPVPKSKLGKVWRQFKQIGPKLLILRGSHAQSSKKFSAATNDKQSAAISVVAIAYARVKPIAEWQYYDLDKIMDIGDILFKKSLYKIMNSNNNNNNACTKKSNKIFKPSDVFTCFYVYYRRITTMIGNDVVAGELNCNDAVTVKKLEENLDYILNIYKCCIYGFNNRYYGIWLDDNHLHIYNSHDTDEYGYPLPYNRGTCCTLRLSATSSLSDYLTGIANGAINKYEIFSVKFLKIIEINKLPTICDTAEPDKKPDFCKENEESTENETAKDSTPVETTETPAVENIKTEEDPTKTKQTEVAELPENFVKPILCDLNQAYQKICSAKGILRCNQFVNEAIKVPCINVAAIVMLRNARSYTWTPDTLNEILSLGYNIYDTNYEKIESKEILATDINEVIHYAKNKYEIDSEQAVIGELVSSNHSISDLEHGIAEFFKIHDSGILQGPQSVAIWQEINLYYMFDPKERDAFGRKWTSQIARDCFKNEPNGSACITWYKNLKDLVECYMGNVPLKHRHDFYRITKIEVVDYNERSENINNWIGIGIKKWIIRGTFSQTNKRFSEKSRNCQGTAISAVALVFNKLLDVAKWDCNIVEQIMVVGDEFYKSSVERLNDEDSFVHDHLKADELDRLLIIGSNKIELLIKDCVINGSILATPDGGTLNLERGLREFFKDNETGLLTTCSISIGIWKKNEYYYLFDSHPRDEFGKNPQTCKTDKKKGNMGTCCAMRFLKIQDLSKTIIMNLELNDIPDYNIARIEIVVSDIDGLPPMYNYQTLKETGGILLSLNNLHEGSKIFDTRANRQTLCNMLTCLAMSKLNASIKWNRNDLNDIIKMGDKMFCRITNKLGHLIDDNFILTWEDVMNEIKIGTNKFTLDRSIVDCTFYPMPEPVKDVETGSTKSLSTKQASNNAVVPAGQPGPNTNSPLSSKIQRLSSLNFKSSKEIEVEVEIPPPPPDLKKCLKEWEFVDFADAILESDLFSLAIWKQDNLYFVFDPKISNEDGTIEKERFEEAKERVIHRKEVEAAEEAAAAEAAAAAAAEALAAAEAEKQETTSKTSGSKASSNKLIPPAPVVEEKTKSIESVISKPKMTVHQPARLPSIHTNIDESDEEKTDEKPQGYAYVCCFQTPDDMFEHIVSQNEPEHEYEKIKLSKLNFISQLNECKDEDDNKVMCSWYNFNMVNVDHWIIRGSLSQNDHIFPKIPNRNKQDITNCIIVLSLATVCKITDWNTTIIDVILKYGDRLYTKSIVKLRKLNKLQNINCYKLKLDDIVTPFTISNIKLSFNIVHYTNGDITASTNCIQIRNLDDTLADFFNTTTGYGILIAKNYYVSIWKFADSYFMFDSHDIGPDGKRKMNGFACLSRFQNIKTLINLFLCNLEYVAGFNSFQLYDVKINKTRVESEANICPSDIRLIKDIDNIKSTFIGYTNDETHNVAVLFGLLSESSIKFKFYNNPPTACNCIAAMATSCCVNVEYWTTKTIDKILILGDRLYEETIEELDDSFNPLTERLLPQKVNQTFIMSSIICYFNVEFFQSSLILSKESGTITLKNSIGQFFNDHKYGIIIFKTFLVTIWKECNSYYIFYPQSIDTDYKFNLNNHACLIKCKTFVQLYDLLMLNIDENMYLTKFDILKIDLTLSSIKTLCEQERVQQELLNNMNYIKCLEDKQVKEENKCCPEDKPTEKDEQVQEAIENIKFKKHNRPGFTILPNGTAIIRGKITNGNDDFACSSRGKQSAAISIIALIMHTLKAVNNWSGETIDLIIRSGDILYRDTVAVNKTPKITIKHLLRKIYINNLCINVTLLSPRLGCCNETDLYNKFMEIFKETNTIYFNMKDEYICIFLFDCFLYLFDSYPCNYLGKRGCLRNNGAGCLIKFRTIHKLIEHILEMYICCGNCEFSTGVVVIHNFGHKEK